MATHSTSHGYARVPETELATTNVRKEGEITLRVLDIKGRTFTLDSVSVSASIGELKNEIERVSEVPVAMQRLIYGGRALGDDTQTVGECGVKHNTVMHMFQKPAAR